MDDALPVRLVQSIGKLDGVFQNFMRGQ